MEQGNNLCNNLCRKPWGKLWDIIMEEIALRITDIKEILKKFSL